MNDCIRTRRDGIALSLKPLEVWGHQIFLPTWLAKPNKLKQSFFLIVIVLLSLSVTAQVNSGKRKRIIENSPVSNNPNTRAVAPQDEPAPEGSSHKGESRGAQKKMADSTTHGVPFYTPNADSAIKIGLLLPFDFVATSGKIYGYMNDKELAKGDIYKLRESSREALDFYQGLQYAVNHTKSKQKIEFYTYDTENSDSVVQELLKNPVLKTCNLIIGPATPQEAKTVAAFCKKNSIINIQPFVASKSIATENPFLVRLVPTIDAHLQKEYEMVMDSFSDKNIIVYTTRRERDMSAAKQLDTLFRSYNAVNSNKLRYTLLINSDSSASAAKHNLATHLLPKEQNVVMLTCYDEPLVNSLLRTNSKDNTVIFGMPTWIDGEQIRVDYLNNAQPYFTDNFYADTSKTQVTEFMGLYMESYAQRPSRYSYMGYDAMNYLSAIFDKYGFAIADGINKESYEGLGYSFHLSPAFRTSRVSNEMVVNYYTNTAMHLFQVHDYRIWLIK
ncbi:MAG: putative amino acid transporter [Bacteroidetes bacterium]|nr:putative amino acid transporter [Bacteroidota bacterium]